MSTTQFDESRCIVGRGQKVVFYRLLSCFPFSNSPSIMATVYYLPFDFFDDIQVLQRIWIVRQLKSSTVQKSDTFSFTNFLLFNIFQVF